MKMTPEAGALRIFFNKFAGREVPMTEEKKQMRIGCVIKRYTVVHPADPNDPVLKEMDAEARRQGKTLSVTWPGRDSTGDLRPDRINAEIVKGADGKWRAGPKFTCG